MKRFLTSHFNLEDDLRRAAKMLEETGDAVEANVLRFYADDIKNYRPEKRYLCDAGQHYMSGLRVWQKNTLTIAKRYEHCVFTQQEIEDLTRRLQEFAKTQKNVTEKICGPEFERDERYDIPISIRIGSGCYVRFTLIKGDYEYV